MRNYINEAPGQPANYEEVRNFLAFRRGVAFPDHDPYHIVMDQVRAGAGGRAVLMGPQFNGWTTADFKTLLADLGEDYRNIN